MLPKANYCHGQAYLPERDGVYDGWGHQRQRRRADGSHKRDEQVQPRNRGPQSDWKYKNYFDMDYVIGVTRFGVYLNFGNI